MSADVTPVRDEVAALLAEHSGWTDEVDEERSTEHSPYWRFRCSGCRELLPLGMDAGSAHRTHQADALLPLLTRVRDEGERSGIQFAICVMHGARPTSREPSEQEQRVLDLLRARRAALAEPTEREGDR